MLTSPGDTSSNYLPQIILLIFFKDRTQLCNETDSKCLK